MFSCYAYSHISQSDATYIVFLQSKILIYYAYFLEERKNFPQHILHDVTVILLPQPHPMHSACIILYLFVDATLHSLDFYKCTGFRNEGKLVFFV